MASASKVKIGSTWKISIQGTLTRVKVIAKQSKEGGGTQFKVRRVDAQGNVSGRSLVRGARALKPDDEAPLVSHPEQQAAPARPEKPKPKKPRKSRKKTEKRRASSFFSNPAPRAEPKKKEPLGSLRGALLTTSRRRTKKRASSKGKSKGDYPSTLVRDLCKALMRTDGSEWAVRSAFTQVMTDHSLRKYSF